MRRYRGWVFSLAVLAFVACAGERKSARIEKGFQEQLEYLRSADRETWPYLKTDIEAALDDLARLFEYLQASIS